MHKSVQNFCAEECLKHLNRIDDFLNCFLPSGLLFHLFFYAGRGESISCLSKVPPFGAGGKVPLACKGESCSCTVVSGTVRTTCEGMVQYHIVPLACKGEWWRPEGSCVSPPTTPWYASPSTRYSAPGNQQAL